MAETPQTRWLIVAVPGNWNLKVEMTVDTDAPAVIEHIEAAAEAQGVKLQRIEGDG